MAQNNTENNEENMTYIQGDTPKRRFPINFSDRIQVIYEMLRKATLSREPIEDVCQQFGFSSKRPYYYYLDKFKEDGIMGLKKEKPGPKEPSKRTEKLEKKIIELRFNRPSLNMYDINDILKKEGYDVSPTTVSRVLNEHGLTKKKRKKESK